MILFTECLTACSVRARYAQSARPRTGPRKQQKSHQLLEGKDPVRIR